ncbi:hypothetical protein LTS16_000990 [Friedmanniomyces endolithicus]|nr:hypothetical protein LTS09_013230 [Friedmanniomyces endolithicus]KAK0287414.1 hypothetical protein LTR35_003889 [Friedmanniomyces endolithicus]KAK0300294.1 hypothetical protein LTS00_001366 [Friedmanniomyces endolithicus]KAK0314798.1 hypothetical protein LTR01_001622 [Friedmanniomyces endolithicus]KAK1000065.1 hypothetical protein LTR54_008988 [Friedmanniomyces endolithicus]
MSSISRPSSIHNVATPERVKAEHNIALIDHTRPQAAERNPSTSTAAPSIVEPPAPLFKRLTNQSFGLQESVRQQLAKQKYAKYGQDRYTESIADSSAKPTDPADDATPQRSGTGYLDRGRAVAKGLLKRRRTRRLGQEQNDTVIEILYENQRGWFLFGVPRFSASTLLPSDPRPWQNAQFRTSPVSILDAQLPDPSWEWVWKSWYVDMSRDVDEEGFVRRRRWLRVRRRKDEKRKVDEKGLEMTAEYFTVHPRTLKPSSDEMRSRSRMDDTQKRVEDVGVEKMEISTIGELALALRKAAVDREKLSAVRKFVNSGGEELFFLAGQMEEIMSRFVYQSSRRQLLTELISHHDMAHEQLGILDGHDHTGDDEKLEQHGAAVKLAENLHRAVQAAESQVARLEYWSDMKDVAKLDPAIAANGKHPEATFRSKQEAHEGAHEPHKHPEHADTGARGAKGTISKQSSRSAWFDAPLSPDNLKTPSQRKTSSARLGRSPDGSESSAGYITAAESVHDVDRAALSPAQKGKEKAAKLSSLDGMMDEEPTSPIPRPRGERHAASPRPGLEDGDQEGDAEADMHGQHQRASDPEPPPALSGSGAGGVDEVGVSGKEAAAAEEEGQGMRLMAPKVREEDVDVVEVEE